MDLFVL